MRQKVGWQAGDLCLRVDFSGGMRELGNNEVYYGMNGPLLACKWDAWHNRKSMSE